MKITIRARTKYIHIYTSISKRRADNYIYRYCVTVTHTHTHTWTCTQTHTDTDTDTDTDTHTHTLQGLRLIVIKVMFAMAVTSENFSFDV